MDTTHQTIINQCKMDGSFALEGWANPQTKQVTSFGFLCSELLRTIHQWDDAMNDMDMHHAPSECGKLVEQTFVKEIRSTILDWEAMCDMPFFLIWEQLENRVSGKWLFESGLQQVELYFPEGESLWKVLSQDELDSIHKVKV